jgi:hypothetical protein
MKSSDEGTEGLSPDELEWIRSDCCNIAMTLEALGIFILFIAGLILIIVGLLDVVVLFTKVGFFLWFLAIVWIVYVLKCTTRWNAKIVRIGQTLSVAPFKEVASVLSLLFIFVFLFVLLMRQEN